ncbi:hypothetical protein [Mycobacterium sp. SMC-17]|uniref:hypothetical protein n=1 Tax=Mycobacterium sp. SMC-17 TaxID=3381628 RepID=UPI00387653D6
MTDKLVQEVPLPRADTHVIRRQLHINDDLPIEPFDFDVATVATARNLAAFSDQPVTINPRLVYQLAFSADQQQ